jgi:hypothetical protein
MKALLIFLLSLMTQGAFARVDVPDEALTFDFNIKTVRMSSWREEKIDEAIEILRQVFASQEFKDRILRHTYRGRRSFADNKGLSNWQIYQKILRGVERLHPYSNNAMDLEVELFTDYSSPVIGYTYPRTKRVWINTKFFNRRSPGLVAANLTHEWLHKLGFGHVRESSYERRKSVPYAIGHIVRDLAKNYE